MTETIAQPMDEVSYDQLRQLVGLVDYDESKDPFPVKAMDAVVFVAGNTDPVFVHVVRSVEACN